MSKSIYVGNLPFGATEDEVKDLFAQHGPVEAVKFIYDRETGRFRGFCFVEMEDEAANAAIEALNDKDFGGRRLKINEARERERRPASNRQAW